MARVLIADDEPHVIRILKRALEASGHSVCTAANGEDALRQILAGAPDILISDIQMPRMSGEQLCERIAAEVADRSFPIVVMTSMTFVSESHWSRRYQNLVLLEKPLSVRKLQALVASLLPPPAVAAAG